MGGRGWRGRSWLAVFVLLAGLLAACGDGADDSPGEAEARPARTIAFLRAVPGTDPAAQDAFLGELEDAGWTQGENLTVLAEEPTEAHTDPADIERTLREWGEQDVDLVVALSSTGATAAIATLPDAIVLFLSNDPTAVGLVENERRPEGNATGATFRVPGDRSLTIARRVLPDLRRVAFVYPPSDPAAVPHRDNMAAAARSLGLDLLTAEFASDADIPGAVSRLAASDIQLLFLSNSPTTVRSFAAFGAAVAGTPLPVMANTTTNADFALIVLEPDVTALYEQMGRQAVRLLSGTPVREVPVEDPARFRLVLNVRMAQQLGITFPPGVEEQADQVIR